jgi:hypothetical protein
MTASARTMAATPYHRCERAAFDPADGLEVLPSPRSQE